MERSEDDTLFAELRELRPTPRPEFAAELDARAAAGFPRGERTSAAAMPFKLVADWWRGKALPKRLIPALGMALTVLVVATVVVSISQSGGGSSSSIADSINVERGVNRQLAPESTVESSEAGAGEAGGGAEEAEESGSVESAPAEEVGGAAGAAAAPTHGQAEYGAEKAEAEVHAEKAPQASAKSYSSLSALNGRNIERSAYIVLGTKPGEVSAAAAKVYSAVHTVNGVVLHSSVQSGNGGATGASFSLLIPSAKLNDTLATFSSIAEVRQRHDATNDITAPTVSAAEELADSNATIDGLLKELADVETEAERESVEARLREERRHHAGIRASLDQLHKRASMSEVTLRIVTGHGAGVTPPSRDDGNWDVGDALHDAGHVLTIAAGVLLIGLAVLAPFALFALLFWAGNRFRVRHLRERTLS
jgi:Domain of unknown function (DUF4349)